MAKFTPSPIVGEIRNKIGGNVFTKVKAGPMVRVKVSPLQPRTNCQRNIRASFTGLSRAFVALTDAQRLAWISAAQNFPVHDSLGKAVYLTGLQMYQRLNRALQTINEATIDTPPATLTVNYPGPVTFARIVGPPVQLNVGWTNSGLVGGSEKTVIFATRPLSPGRSTGGSAFRFVFWSGAGLPGPFNIATEYTAKFGAPIVGRKIYVLAFLVKITSGAQGTGSTASVIY